MRIDALKKVSKLAWMKATIPMKKIRKSYEKLEFEDENHIEIIMELVR